MKPGDLVSVGPWTGCYPVLGSKDGTFSIGKTPMVGIFLDARFGLYQVLLGGKSPVWVYFRDVTVL